VKEGECDVYTYVNGKMIPVQTIAGVGGERKRRMVEKVNSTLICCKNLYKCHNVPTAQQQQKRNSECLTKKSN
jgi:hypothetical protein